jgi:SAM-dependent methyltransferase
MTRQAKHAEWAEQWSVFYDDRLDLFLEWIHPFTLRDFDGKSVMDAGCGPGHHIAMVAPHARRMVGVDLNTAAIARRLTQAHANATVLEDDIAAMKLGEQFDIVYSIGVVHHTDDPAATVRNLADHVRPGGHLILWVYSYEGNFLNRTLVEFCKRHALRPLPRPALLVLARVLTAALYPPVHTLYRLPLRRLPYHAYFESFRRLPFRRNLLNVFDKLNAPQTAFLRRREVEAWFPHDRFADVHISGYRGVSWRASGRKR